MSEHELWNELGNLYFLSGAHEQAIHAYTRSIALDKKYGRPYCNMALAYVQKGRCNEAINMYERGINLLSDDHEKALSWSKLGDVYRHLKDYRMAVQAYEWADVLDANVRRHEGAANRADVLLNRRTPIEDVFSLVETDEATTGKETEVKDASPLEESLPLLLEELTPWDFDDQVPPPEEEELHPLFDLWFTEEAGVTGFDEGVISIEPLQWRQESVAEDISVEEAVAEEELVVPSQDEESDLEAEQDEVSVSETVTPVLEEEGSELEESTIVTPSFESTTTEAADVETMQYEQADQMISVQLTPEEQSSLDIEIFRCTRVLEINPHNPAAWDRLGGLYKIIERYDEAVEAYQKAISLDRTKAPYHYHLGLVYAAQRRIEDAIHAFEQVIAIEPEHGLAHAALGGYHRRMGQEELAQEHIEKAMSLMNDDENEYNRACMEAICGNTDRAFELLEFALKNRQTAVAWVQRDPDLDFIRSDPRFHSLIVEYGALAQAA